MLLFGWQDNKFKILNITIFKLKGTPKGIYFYFLGIPVYKSNGALSKVIAAVKSNKDFDTRNIDRQIENLISPFAAVKTQKDDKKIGFLATEIYDMGGHTKCIKDLAQSLSDHYQPILFLIHKSVSIKSAPISLNLIQKYAQICGIDANFVSFKTKCKDFSNQIIASNIKVLLSYIHPDDVFGTAVLAYLKHTTDIKIIYANHASHYPALGMSFADLILEGMPTTEKITHEKRHITNTKIIGLQSLSKDETTYYSDSERKELRNSLGIKSDEYVTMSGGAPYKFFDTPKKSAYFEMIKDILVQEPKLKHIIISQFNRQQNAVIDNIFLQSPELKSRIIFIPYQANFDKWFQAADVFIDSFPVSSALTQIDLMRNKVASVVKINTENPLLSFHEYQMPNYPYMFKKVADMEQSVLDLLHNPQKRKDITEKNYKYWLNNYESSVFKNKILRIINGDNNE